MKDKNAGKGTQKKISVVGKPKNNTEKELLSDNKEFASIFQLLFGKDFINPDELRDFSETDTLTIAEGDEILFSKEFIRDIRKLWVKTDGKKVYLCLENQTNLDIKDIVRFTIYTLVNFLSVMEKTGEIIPVVPLILYWGKAKFDREINFRDLYPKDVTEDIMRYQPNLLFPVISILDITEEEIELLSLPLREAIIPIQITLGKNDYNKVVRLLEKLKELTKTEVNKKSRNTVVAVTGSDFYKKMEVTKENEVEKVDLFHVFDYLKDDMKAEGKAEGIAEGIAEGEARAFARSVINLSNKKFISYDEAMNDLEIEEDKRDKVLKYIDEMK